MYIYIYCSALSRCRRNVKNSSIAAVPFMRSASMELPSHPTRGPPKNILTHLGVDHFHDALLRTGSASNPPSAGSPDTLLGGTLVLDDPNDSAGTSPAPGSPSGLVADSPVCTPSRAPRCHPGLFPLSAATAPLRAFDKPPFDVRKSSTEPEGIPAEGPKAEDARFDWV
jgi:hypothetical protein